jgi:hypothetical protein
MADKFSLEIIVKKPAGLYDTLLADKHIFPFGFAADFAQGAELGVVGLRQ